MWRIFTSFHFLFWIFHTCSFCYTLTFRVWRVFIFWITVLFIIWFENVLFLIAVTAFVVIFGRRRLKYILFLLFLKPLFFLWHHSFLHSHSLLRIYRLHYTLFCIVVCRIVWVKYIISFTNRLFDILFNYFFLSWFLRLWLSIFLTLFL